MSRAKKNDAVQTDKVLPLHPQRDGAADAASHSDPALQPLPPELSLRCDRVLPDNYSTESLDHAIKAHLARFTMGVTPFGLSSLFFDWWVHLAGSPGKQVQLMEKAMRKAAQLAITTGQQMQKGEADPCILPLEHDKRFDAPEWQQWPFNLIYQNFLLTQQWWYNATNDIDGMSRRDEQAVSFVARQLLDLMSPSNSIWTNPEVIAKTTQEGGANLIRGAQNMIEDWERAISGKPPVGAEDYLPGRDVAVTPGKVVYRSHLFELIQYAPQTDTVAAEPILIVPAWIMKYYILDLSPHNSFVRYLVEQGHAVFMISWRNPDANDRDQGMAEYLDAVDQALDAVGEVVPDAPINAVGYCLGGTLLATKAAQMARDHDDRLKTMSLLATQVDFKDPGELQLFISESEVSFLEHMMWDQGYLDTKQMAGAFQLLRSTDLIWSRYVHEYLMGGRQGMFDLMAWNADATRMPYKMHSEYLRSFYLDNALSQGQYEVGGKPVAITDISAQVFCVSTTGDHVAPWQSVYKLHLLSDTDITFVLTSGGHNAGIVSEPGHRGRSYQITTTPHAAKYVPPEDWRAQAPLKDGSWWPEFVTWLRAHSSGTGKPPHMGGTESRAVPMGDAPGTYVFQR
ncbi:alpha/beta fold hydrolase [Aliiroseovarius sp. S1339]|uniref:PHA/PHB synthase family protein n=1 Tax=Aliiroseovarius sp. S1339 TaxID=2936990 RepID=UPI0020C0FD14|nr:alpha/beta fold hydrolase [Aliiroseovarius sp. S1339]MCK8465537.1 alpha/beta fold hydrolase [Aliiroseovarius sp. S1339]